MGRGMSGTRGMVTGVRPTRLAIVFVVLALLAIIQVGAAAQAKQPLTHETMWLMKRVGAPVVSPDGRWAVMAVVEPAYDEASQVSDLWIVPTSGSSPARRLTSGKGAESGAVWSPDSRRLAFAARRDGDEAPQIYLLDVFDGGEARRLTSLLNGARSPQWRPDGRAVVFQSGVYPGAKSEEENRKLAADRKARKYRARVYDGFPIRNWDRWIDELQTHLFVQTLEEGSVARDLLAGSQLAASPGFAGVTTPGGDDLQPVWAPDGRSVVFVATADRNVEAYAESSTHFYRVPASGGEPLALTSGRDSYVRPTFSPDGKRLFGMVSPNTDQVYNLNRIFALDWPVAPAVRILSPTFDRAPTTFVVTPNGRYIFLLAEDAGHEKLYVVPTDGGPTELSFELTAGVYTNLAIGGKDDGAVLLANWESAVSPPEVVRIEPEADRHVALTDFNAAAAAKIDWQPLRHFSFTSQRGRQIHNMIVLPPDFDENRKYPLLNLIHGGPHTMWRDQYFTRWNYHLLAAPGYVVLLTNYTGSTGFGEKFAQGIKLDPLKGPGEELNEAADEAIRRFRFIDGGRQAAGGASYGGHLANWLQATTTRYKCLISHAGLINLESQWGTSDVIYSREVNNGGPVWEQGPVWREQNPIRRAANFQTPMLITVGENDFRVPLNNSLENWSIHQRRRIPSRLIVFPEENHWILRGENSRFFYGEVADWLKKWLK